MLVIAVNSEQMAIFVSPKYMICRASGGAFLFGGKNKSAYAQTSHCAITDVQNHRVRLNLNKQSVHCGAAG